MAVLHEFREANSVYTPFHPRSPYGFAKLYAHWACVNYRQAYDMFVSNGIFYNHESPRRGLEFVTRKIARGVARIALGVDNTITLGNMQARRDWGWAPDYVELMWRILQHDTPDDFVGATGESYTIWEFVKEAFFVAGVSDPNAAARAVLLDGKNVRPSEVYNLRGDASKAKKLLGWEPTVRFKELVKRMVDAEMSRATQPQLYVQM